MITVLWHAHMTIFSKLYLFCYQSHCDSNATQFAVCLDMSRFFALFLCLCLFYYPTTWPLAINQFFSFGASNRLAYWRITCVFVIWYMVAASIMLPLHLIHWDFGNFDGSNRSRIRRRRREKIEKRHTNNIKRYLPLIRRSRARTHGTLRNFVQYVCE